MKNLLVTLNGNYMDQKQVLCRSHETDTPSKILNRLEKKLEQNGRFQKGIQDHEIISDEKAEQVKRNHFTYYFQIETDESYADYYGAKWSSSNPVANGPVAYSEK